MKKVCVLALFGALLLRMPILHAQLVQKAVPVENRPVAEEAKDTEKQASDPASFHGAASVD